MKKNKFFTMIFLLLAVLWIGFSFRNSMQTASVSGSWSREVLYKIKSTFPSLGFLSERILRKMAHIFEYTVLGFFLTNFWHTIAKSGKFKTLGFIFTAFPIPFIDEYIQLSSYGRTARLKDVFIDSFGLIQGACIALLLISIIKKIKEVIRYE